MTNGDFALMIGFSKAIEQELNNLKEEFKAYKKFHERDYERFKNELYEKLKKQMIVQTFDAGNATAIQAMFCDKEEQK